MFTVLNPHLFLLIVITAWISGIVIILLFRRELLYSTWKEPYIGDPVVIIESDDWGPGPSSHAKSLNELAKVLENHRDSVNRPAVLTANIVLSVPDAAVIRENDFQKYARVPLDESSPDIMAVLKKYISQGLIVPQLHGLEHFNPDILLYLVRNGNEAIRNIFKKDGWTSWEALEPSLQRHYLVRNIFSPENITTKHSEIVNEATVLFEKLFHHDSLSTAAPGYFWTDETEEAFHLNGIRYIQTEGYRYIGGHKKEQMCQDPEIIRFGTKNTHNQTYLVRNVMYEPCNDKTVDDCWKQTIRSFRQALPAIICTHRCNYIDDKLSYKSLKGLDELLTKVDRHYPSRRYLSSPELGEWLESGTIYNRFAENGKSKFQGIHFSPIMQKISGFFFRLWYRHKKIRLITIFSSLILPVSIFIAIAGLSGKQKSFYPALEIKPFSERK